MDSFTTPVRTSDFVLAPKAFGLVWRKHYVSKSSEEDPLAQPLMDTPETNPETQLLVRHRDERDGFLLSTPQEVEGDHGLGELWADNVNEKDMAQLDDAFLEAFENLHISSPVGVNVSCISCFCSCLRHRSQEEKDKMEE
ncbi:unnamed protein product [Caretta caretta]